MGFVIEKLTAWVAIEDNGDEGVVGIYHPTLGGWMPLIAAEPERLKAFEEHAAHIAERTGKTLHLIEFTNRKHVRYINPKH